MKQRQGYIITMLCASLLLTLCGCADDSSDSMSQHMQELHLSLGYPSFHSTDGVTRAINLPESFEPYAHGSSLQPISQIQCYMTYEKDGSKYIPCQFDHITTTTSEFGHIWTSTVPLYTLDSGKSYYLYGYMPKENVGSGVTIDHYDNDFAKGVVMTLTGLNAVTPDDICVIVGAKGYDGTAANIPNMTERLGKFDYYPDIDGTSLFLLVDHIYAGLKFNMTLDIEYAALRGIKVKNIKLKPEDGDNDVVETVEAVVTIVANSANPMKVDFPEEKFTRGKSPQPAVIYNGEGKSLSTTEEEFMACFCPTTYRKFTLETTYDVLDNKGNLIREGQTARNAISLENDLKAGELHIVNIKVKPTYLYVLSDPDLDSPTFVMN